MDKKSIVSKVIKKLAVLGKPKDPISEDDKQKLLKIFWNEKEPRNVIKILQTFFQEKKPSKEAKQELFTYFKLKGLFKQSLNLNENMEKAWRLLLKENNLREFLLEN